MPILNQYGQGVTSRHFVNAANPYSQDRPWMPKQLGDIDDLIPAHDREMLISVSRKLFCNMGFARGAIIQKAMYSIGRGWDVKFEGENKEWGDSVAKLLNEQWFKVCDIRGKNYDWKTLLFLDSVALDRDGDFAIILTESKKTGWPLMQRVGAHRIGNRTNEKHVSEEGDYKGLRIRSGVVRSKYGAPVAYKVLGDTVEEDRIISANDMVLTFDPDWHDQERGTPAFSHCLDDMRDMLQSQQWEQMVMLMLSSIGLIEYNDTGESEDDNTDLLTDSDGNVVAGQIETNTFSGGMVKHYKAGSGNKLETITQDRPSDVWDRFNDRLTRSALAGINWPFSMAWKPSGQGTAERADLERAAKSVEDRQDTIELVASRVIKWAISKFIKMGRIEAPPVAGDWLRFGFTKPAKISINFKNDTKALLELYAGGFVTGDFICTAFGSTFEQTTRAKAREVIMRKTIADEEAAGTDYEIEDREMHMLTPNEVKEENTNTQEDES